MTQGKIHLRSLGDAGQIGQADVADDADDFIVVVATA